MQVEDLKRIVQQIIKQRSESQTIELKTADHDCPTRLFDTLSSFSNQDEGGVIVFGISEKDGYTVKGVYDVQDLQKKVTEQCKQMEPPVRALFTVCELDGKYIVSAEIPAVDYILRPAFYRGVGRIRGSYIRVGESDELMNEYEIYSFDAYKRRIREELRTCKDFPPPLINQQLLEVYLQAVRSERKNLANNVSDEEIMELMGITKEGIMTLAGLLVFSKYPQAYYPQLCITAVALPGLEMGQLGSSQERFLDNERITGSFIDMLNGAVEFVRRNSRIRTIIDDNGQRADKSEYPIKAVREAILNALIHRDYSMYSENTPIRIEMYRNRLEIINNGALYGTMTLNNLGKVRPETRNPALANIMELLKITENGYSGIPTMRMELLNAGLPAPLFSMYHGEFKVTISNDYHDVADPSQALINYCIVPRSRDELAAFTGKTRNYTMTKIVQPLIEQGLIKLTLPNKPKSSLQRYVKNTDNN